WRPSPATPRGRRPRPPRRRRPGRGATGAWGGLLVRGDGVEVIIGPAGAIRNGPPGLHPAGSAAILGRAKRSALRHPNRDRKVMAVNLDASGIGQLAIKLGLVSEDQVREC